MGARGVTSRALPAGGAPVGRVRPGSLAGGGGFCPLHGAGADALGVGALLELEVAADLDGA